MKQAARERTRANATAQITRGTRGPFALELRGLRSFRGRAIHLVGLPLSIRCIVALVLGRLLLVALFIVLPVFLVLLVFFVALLVVVLLVLLVLVRYVIGFFVLLLNLVAILVLAIKNLELLE